MGLKQEQHLTFVDCTKEYFRSTSTHGLRRVGWSQLGWVRICWCVVFVLALIAYICMLYFLLKEYKTYPTKAVVTKEVGFQDFPGVTICNINPIVKRRIKGKKAEASITDPFYAFTEDAKFNISRFGEVDPFLRETAHFAAHVAGLRDVKQRQGYGHFLNEMVIHCAFDGRECDLKTDFVQLWNDVYGNCYTFSGGKLSDTFKTQSTREPGPLNGLSLIIDTQPEEHLRSYTQSKGVRILVHPHTAMPFPQQGGLSIPAGMEATISLDVSRHKYLGSPYTYCSYSTGNKFGYSYTSVACQKICKQEAVLTYCKCADPTLPISDDQPLCSLNDIYSAEYRCHGKVMADFTVGSRQCDCPVPCSEYTYNTDFSVSMWPDSKHAGLIDLVLDPVAKKNIRGRKFDKHNLVSAKVFYREIGVTVFTEEATFTLADFLTHMGGLSALALGISILTVVEFLEYLFTMITIPWVNYPPWEEKKEEEEEERPPTAGEARPETAATTRDVEAQVFTPDNSINTRPLPSYLQTNDNIVQST